MFRYYNRMWVAHGSSPRVWEKCLQKAFNFLMDLEKVVGGSSEAFWLLIRKGLVLSAKEGVATPAPGTDEYTALQDTIQDFEHQIRRVFLAGGYDVNDLDATVVSGKEQTDLLISCIAGTTGIPKRILIGSERGELASSQDDKNWADNIAARQTQICEEWLTDLIERLMQIGALPRPSAGEFSVEWPSLFELNPLENADLAGRIATALTTVTGGAPDALVELEEFVKVYIPALLGSVMKFVRPEEENPDDDQPGDDNPDKEGKRAAQNARPFLSHMGPGDHPSGSSQDVHAGDDTGRAEEMGRTLIDQLRDGGFSESLEGKSPTSGYMTAISQDTEKTYPIDKVAASDIQDYVLEHYKELQQEDAYLGGWLDEEHPDLAYLDVSYNYQSLDETVEIARRSNQKGIYDIANGRTIYIDYKTNKLYYYKDKEKTIKVFVR